MAFNKAMLGKQAWRLHNDPNSLCSQVFKGLYFPSKPFHLADKGSRPSWGWQSILLGRENVLPNVRWSVGNGERIRIREDRWLSMGIIHGPAAREEPTMLANLID